MRLGDKAMRQAVEPSGVKSHVHPYLSHLIKVRSSKNRQKRERPRNGEYSGPKTGWREGGEGKNMCAS